MDPAQAKLDNWLFFHSDLDLSETFVICEVVTNIFDKANAFKPVQTIGLGIVAIRIMNKEAKAVMGQKTLDVLLTTPRIFMLFEEDQKIDQKLLTVKANQNKYAIDVTVSGPEVLANATQIFKFVPANCLVSPVDTVPGLADDKLPAIYTEDF